MSQMLSDLVPRGSLGLKLLLVCCLVVAMLAPLLMVHGLVFERQTRAGEVTSQIGETAGGAQTVGGPMLLVPYRREHEARDARGWVQQRTERGYYIVFAENGTANATLRVSDRRKGIYRAATYVSETALTAQFRPAAALRDLDPSYTLDWANARVMMFVGDSRAVRDVVELTFSDGSKAVLEPLSELSVAAPTETADGTTTARTYSLDQHGIQAFAARAPFTTPPADFRVETRLVLGGAQRFAVAAFAKDTGVSIRGDRRDASADGFFQSANPMRLGAREFSAEWRVPYVARGVQQVANISTFNIGDLARRDMAVSFVTADDVYNGVIRAVRYGIMFIGIVFLATLIFEAVSGKKAHAAQYILVGLAQCVFYLLLLSITELYGFDAAFAIAASATVLLLAYYAGTSFRSASAGIGALVGLGALYGAMYVLMTLEDFAMLAGSLVAFLVIAATMIATRGVDWYGRRPAVAAAEE